MEKYIKRDAENLVFSALDAGYIAAILGARQTGKTTLMEKLKEEFIKKGFSEGRIFSFNFKPSFWSSGKHSEKVPIDLGGELCFE